MNDHTKKNPKNQIPGIIAELNRRHAIVMVGGKCVVLNETIEPIFGRPDISFSSIQDFRHKYSNRRTGEQTVGQYWLNHPMRRQYEGIVFLPGGESTTHFNLYRGFSVQPRQGNCSFYLAHLHDNIARGNEEIYLYIIRWMADCVQNPEKRPGTSIVLRGGQGVGKGITCSQFGCLFWPHFVHISNSRQLLGKFNAHLKDALVVFADEALWAGDKQHEGILKFLVTEETLPIEYKGKDIFFVRNHIRLLVSSNSEWVVPAGLDERRFLVLDVGEDRKQDRAYFGELIQQMDSGGREALLHYLMHYDLSGVDLGRIPHTEALRETKILSMSPVQKFWFGRLSEGKLKNQDEWTSLVSSTQLHEEFVEEAEKSGQVRRATETEFGIGLRKLVPALRRIRRMIDGKRSWVLEVPDLQVCRDYFDKIMNCKNPWPED